jgi:curved DNA-binding protein
LSSPGKTGQVTMTGDYYEVLGVPRSASAEELQWAYHKLAREYHPDVNSSPEAEDRFKEINEAYHVLADPAQRARYDRFGANFREVPEGAEAASGFGRSRAYAGRRTGAPPNGYDFAFREGGIDIDDLFSGLFGTRGAGGPIPGADQAAELQVSLEEAYRGGHRRLSLDGREVDVAIPRGIVDGQRIRLSGLGGRGRGDAPAGDLFLKVRIAPDPRYRVRGRDVSMDLPVAQWEAVLGATVAVTTPGGEAKVKMPAGSSSGRRLRMRGQGIPNPNGTPGDLYAEVRIMVPSKPSPREQELFEELAKVSTFNPRAQGRRQ